MTSKRNITEIRRQAIVVVGFSIGESSLPLTEVQRRRLKMLEGYTLNHVAAYEGVQPNTIVRTVREAVRRVEPVIEAAADCE